MRLEQLLMEIEAISWFTNLGSARASGLSVPIADLTQWQRFVSASNSAEFGLSHDEPIFSAHPFSELSWLPTTNAEPDPIHGDALAVAAKRGGLEAGLVSAKLAGFKAATKSQRSSDENPVLRVGPVNLNEAARSGGRYACRLAAAEAFLGQAGFWCDLVQVYTSGNWPFALLPGNKVVVL